MNSFPSMPRRLRANISGNPDPMNLKLARRRIIILPMGDRGAVTNPIFCPGTFARPLRSDNVASAPADLGR